MKRTNQLTAAFSALTLMTGCASTGQITYNQGVAIIKEKQYDQPVWSEGIYAHDEDGLLRLEEIKLSKPAKYTITLLLNTDQNQVEISIQQNHSCDCYCETPDFIKAFRKWSVGDTVNVGYHLNNKEPNRPKVYTIEDLVLKQK